MQLFVKSRYVARSMADYDMAVGTGLMRDDASLWSRFRRLSMIGYVLAAAVERCVNFGVPRRRGTAIRKRFQRKVVTALAGICITTAQVTNAASQYYDDAQTAFAIFGGTCP